MTAVLVSIATTTTCLGTGAEMPEFGKSVQFDRSGPSLSMAQLKGKAVLVVFFQSWCGICNGWAPRLLKQVEEAHGAKRSLVLVAIKTDGGGPSEARDYLKSKDADLSLWWVGSDENAAYYKQINPKNDLWGYVLIDASGDIVERGKAGTFWSSGPNKDKYVLAAPDLLKGCGDLETVLPADKEYPTELAGIVRLAEAGCIGKALALCASPGRLSQETAVALKDLKQDILLVADTRMRSRMDVLKNSGNEAATRFETYKELDAMVRECPSAAAAREANAVLAQTRADPLIQKEKMAETAYLLTLQKLQKAHARDKPRLLREMEMVSKRHAGTRYGKLAEETSKNPEP